MHGCGGSSISTERQARSARTPAAAVMLALRSSPRSRPRSSSSSTSATPMPSNSRPPSTRVSPACPPGRTRSVGRPTTCSRVPTPSRIPCSATSCRWCRVRSVPGRSGRTGRPGPRAADSGSAGRVVVGVGSSCPWRSVYRRGPTPLGRRRGWGTGCSGGATGRARRGEGRAGKSLDPEVLRTHEPAGL